MQGQRGRVGAQHHVVTLAELVGSRIHTDRIQKSEVQSSRKNKRRRESPQEIPESRTGV